MAPHCKRSRRRPVSGIVVGRWHVACTAPPWPAAVRPQRRTAMTEPESKREKDNELASPYGPQYGHVDEAAGGADSSALETEPSGEQQEAAEDLRRELPPGKSKPRQ